MHLRTQGRLLHWCPPEAAAEGSKKAMAVPASHPSLCARFVKESALEKRTALLPDIDMIDCAVRQENLNFAGQPIMLQLPLVPAYALTVHKTQVSARAVCDVCVRVACRVVLLDAYARAQVYPDSVLRHCRSSIWCWVVRRAFLLKATSTFSCPG